MKDKNKNEIYLAPQAEQIKSDSALGSESKTKNPVKYEEITVEEKPKAKSRIGEIFNLRDTNRKVYRMSDGTEQAVFFPEAVHVFNERKKVFEDVDNTLTPESDGRHFKNKKGNFTARFSREEDNDELFSIESGIHGVKVFSKKTLTDKNSGIKPYIKKPDKAAAKKSDVLCFSDIESGADYEYSLHGNGIKEDIVIKEKAAVYCYPFIMKCQNVTPEFDEKNKRVTFCSTETGKEVFFIPAPFMTDANGTTSGNVDYVMRTAQNGDVHFSVNADSEWINSDQRAFPVTIDPQIKLSGSTDMTSYSWNNGQMDFESSHKIGVVGSKIVLPSGTTDVGTCGGACDPGTCDVCTSTGMASATPVEVNSWASGVISAPCKSVWFKFVTSTEGIYTIHSSSIIDTVGYLYDPSGTLIACNDDYYKRNFKIEKCLNANTTYYIMVKAFGNGTGNFDLRVAGADAQTPDPDPLEPDVKGTLLTVNIPVSGYITCANEENWYTFKATAGNGIYTITTTGNMDTMGYLYDSNDVLIASNDDTTSSLNFKITASLENGKTYYFKVRAFSEKTGSYAVGVYPKDTVIPTDPSVCFCPNRMYVSLNMPSLPRSPRIKKAMLKLYQKSSALNCNIDTKIGLYKVNEEIYLGHCTPAYDENLVDFAETKSESCPNGVITSYSFDITSILDDYSTGENFEAKFMIKTLNEYVTYQNYIELYGSQSGNSPEIVIDYESGYGINNSYRVHTHDLGRFGQGSIDLQRGNLMFESEDFAWSGSRMPVTIKHLYNSALADYQYTANSQIKLNAADFSAMKIGKGFKLNIMQSMVPASFTHDGTSYSGYVYVDENGTETYFKPDKEVCENNCCYFIYKDVENKEAVYDSKNRTITEGNEIRTFDAAGRLISIKDKTYDNEMQIIYNAQGLITTVIDGAGREFTFAYSNGMLTSITAPDKTTLTYSYNQDKLISVSYPDGQKAVLSYNNNKPSCVTLISNTGSVEYRVQYEFSGEKIHSVVEFDSSNSLGNKTVYSFSAASGRTVVQTYELEDDSDCDCYEITTKTVYTFDDDGNIISEYVYSEDTGNVAAKGEESGINPHSAEGGAGVVSNINNLLFDHGFDSLDNWYNIECNCGDIKISNYAYEPYAKFGRKVLRIQSNNPDCAENGVFQVTETLPAGHYTFSLYMRAITNLTGYNAGAYIRVTDTGNRTLAQSEQIIKADSEFIRLVAPFEISSDQSVKVQIMINGKGTIYADAAQLENNEYANAYNMLINGNFELCSGWNGNGAYCTTSPRFNMRRSLFITGGLDENHYAYQRLYVKSNRSIRETFTLSGWAKGYGLPTHDRDGSVTPTFRLRAIIKYNDSDYHEYGTEEYVADFSPCTDEWQMTSVHFAKSKFRTVDYIDVYIDYGHNFGTAYFDDVQLIRNNIETDLNSDDFETEAETTGTAEAENQTSVESAESEEFKELIDAYGNTLTETTFNDGEFGTIYKSFKFNGDSCCPEENAGNDLIAETDSRGNKTTYTVNGDTSRNEEVTDRCGNKTAYEYDVYGKTTKVTSKDKNNNIQSTVSYKYDSFDNLTEIARGDGLIYALNYNTFHKLESIGVKGKPQNLVTYTYKKGNGRLKEITYANGDRMVATYNSIGQMIAEHWYDKDNNQTANYRYVYDGQENIVKTIDFSTAKEYNYIYEDGVLVQSTQFSVVCSNTEVFHRSFECSIRYCYDSKGKIKEKRINIYDGTEKVIKYENTDNDSQIIRFTAGGKTVTSHSKTDSFGRKVFDELQLGSGFVSRQFSYSEGEFTSEHAENNMLKSTPTTKLVSQIVLSGGRTLSYEYDEEERITKVTDSECGVTEYTYDALGQLLTETVNGTALNTITYDNYGNINTKNGVCYTYDNTWKDLLTGVGDQTISYDAQGNPTSYLGHTLVWKKGRQLSKFDGMNYIYDSNGIRILKMGDGIRHGYLLDGAKIIKETIHEPSGDGVLVPIYDSEDEVCGIEYNGTAYYFLKNLQEDVIAITDDSGNVVAKYSYDTWGVCTITMDSSGCSIAQINPYRYCSYYYDSESGLYYLQSRYYDPTTGRFINGDDPAIVGLLTKPLQHNLFAYCENDPVNYEDPTGNWLIQVVCGVAGAAVFGTVANIVCRLLGVNKTIRRLITAGFALIGGILGAAFGPAVIGKIAPKALAWVNNLEKIVNRKSRLRPMFFEGHVAIGWEWNRRFKIMLHFKHKNEPGKGMHITIQHFTGRNWRRTIPDIPVKSLGKVFINWVKKFLK